MKKLSKAQTREKMVHFLLKYQAASNFLKRREKPNKLRPYFSGPKIQRIIGIRNSARDMYLKYKRDLEAA